ncbi:FecR domain-containing protein [Mucilaginibacter sp. R-33]|uniref:FecR family protein n=1 Tax=Mucilaginibacter sp. R-33 TaxID=3416711 RepID=UPI003CEF408F
MNQPLHITDELLIDYVLNEVSAEEAARVDSWRKLDPENERRFEQFRLIWESSRSFKADAVIDAQASLQKVKQRAAEIKNQQANVVPMRGRYGWLKIAASIIFIAACAWIWFSRFSNPEVKLESQAVVRIDTLSDGTIVTVNKNTRLDHPEKFTGDQRLVNLVKGEAFFNVAHNKAKPFVITAGEALIKVVGTSFNVKNVNGNIEIIVETGLVQVTDSRSKLMILLKPREVVSLNAKTGKFVKQHKQDNLYQYYRSKDLVFKNVKLSRLVTVLNEAYDSHIIIGRKELNDMEIAGSFNADNSLETMLHVIQLTLNIRAEEKQGTIILK